MASGVMLRRALTRCCGLAQALRAHYPDFAFGTAVGAAAADSGDYDCERDDQLLQNYFDDFQMNQMNQMQGQLGGPGGGPLLGPGGEFHPGGYDCGPQHEYGDMGYPAMGLDGGGGIVGADYGYGGGAAYGYGNGAGYGGAHDDDDVARELDAAQRVAAARFFEGQQQQQQQQQQQRQAAAAAAHMNSLQQAAAAAAAHSRMGGISSPGGSSLQV
jgi:hypothetical protein